MEFILSPIFLIALLIVTAQGIKNSSQSIVRKFIYTFTLSHVIIVSLFFMDAAYSWVDLSLMQIVGENILAIIPSFLSLLIILLLFFLGKKVFWGLFILNILQLASIIPVLLLLESDTETSFLSFNTLSMMYLSLAGCFLSIPVGATLIPVKGTRYYEIMYQGREGLLNGLREFARKYNLEYTEPATIYESGGVRGFIGEKEILIDTKPALFPPAYRLTIIVKKGNDVRNFECKSLNGVDSSLEEIESLVGG